MTDVLLYFTEEQHVAAEVEPCTALACLPDGANLDSLTPFPLTDSCDVSGHR